MSADCAAVYLQNRNCHVKWMFYQTNTKNCGEIEFYIHNLGNGLDTFCFKHKLKINIWVMIP